MTTIIARIAPWSLPPGRVSKKGMRSLLAEDIRAMEFNAVPTPGQRGGYFFLDEVPGRMVQVRYNLDRDLMTIEVGQDGKLVKIS